MCQPDKHGMTIMSDPGWTWPALADVVARQPEPSRPLYVPPAELPLAQQMVLLILRRRDALAQKVLTAMRGMGVPEPTKDDWHALVLSRHLTRMPRETCLRGGESRTNKGPLQLTPVMGLLAAKAVADHLAVRYGIHHLTFNPPVGNHGHWVRCTCGFSTFGGAGDSGRSSVANYGRLHLEQAETDTLPPKFKLPRFEATATVIA